MILSVVNKKIDQLLTFTIIALFSVLVAVVAFQVVNRLCLGWVMPWTEELSRYLFIWLAMTGSAKCVYNRGHIVVDLIPALWPGKKSDMMTYVASIITTLFYVLIMFYGYQWALKTAGRFPITMPIDFVYINMIVPVCFTFMLLFHCEHLINDYRKVFLGKEGT